MSEILLDKFKAIALDFDGTIADAVSLHHAARLQALSLMAAETGDERFANIPAAIHDEAHRHGSSPTTIIGWTLQQSGIISETADLHTDPLLAEVVKRKYEAYDILAAGGADEVPGASSFIKKADLYLPERVGLVTVARLEQEVKPFLARYALGGSIPPQNIVSREDIPADRLKPYPDAYLMALGRFALLENPEQLLVIEDSNHGIESAKRAGATVIGIATIHTVQELREIEDPSVRPDFVVASYSEIEELLGLKTP